MSIAKENYKYGLLEQVMFAENINQSLIASSYNHREHSGSVVECLTRDQEAAGLSLSGATVLWSLSKTHLS